MEDTFLPIDEIWLIYRQALVAIVHDKLLN